MRSRRRREPAPPAISFTFSGLCLVNPVALAVKSSPAPAGGVTVSIALAMPLSGRVEFPRARLAHRAGWQRAADDYPVAAVSAAKLAPLRRGGGSARSGSIAGRGMLPRSAGGANQGEAKTGGTRARSALAREPLDSTTWHEKGTSPVPRTDREGARKRNRYSL
jgi:hypothetical protein